MTGTLSAPSGSVSVWRGLHIRHVPPGWHETAGTELDELLAAASTVSGVSWVTAGILTAGRRVAVAAPDPDIRRDVCSNTYYHAMREAARLARRRPPKRRRKRIR